MAISLYSFGEESPLKFELSDKLAKYYNEATAEFFKAQQRFNQKFGRPWDPAADPIQLNWTRAQRKAWDQFGRIFNKVVEEKGPFHVNDIMEDFLVKNAAESVSKTSRGWGHALTLAVGAGALYGLLRGR
jgi:hypothetical protein